MMENKFMKNKKGQYIIELNKKDISTIFIDEFGFTHNEMSPFNDKLNKYAKGSQTITSEAKGLIKDKIFIEASKTLANPYLLITTRLGGGTFNFDEIKIYKAKNSDLLVALSETPNNSYYIQVFDDYNSYIKWWVESYASKNDETVANFIPPKVKLEELLFMLHTIDYYKRLTYQNLLDYKTQTPLLAKFTDFSENMNKSIKSRDIRWLLPAFIAMTPGIAKYNLDINVEDVKVLTTQNFIGNKKDPETNENMMAFGESSLIMGLEFMRTWMLCAGFEIKILINDKTKEIDRFFIAPTALTNHFIRLEDSDDNKCMVNHQAYTIDQLSVKMQEIFEASVDQKPTSKFCSKCSTPLSENAKFCIKCGNKS